MFTTALWTTWLAACGGGPTLDVKVVDVWSNPVAGATLVQDGITERFTVDGSGMTSLQVKPGSVRLLAGADGYIKDATIIQVEEDSEENTTALLTLFPIPPDAGFHGIGAKSYVKMIEAPVEVMATEMTTFHGIKDIPKAAGLSKTNQSQRFVFQTTLREQELKRMDIHLSKLDFQEKAMVTGLLGDEEVDVNLWIAGTDVSYKVKSMEAADNYLVATDAPLESGVYAFHAQGILDAREADALNKLPKEMKIVYAFEVP